MLMSSSNFAFAATTESQRTDSTTAGNQSSTEYIRFLPAIRSIDSDGGVDFSINFNVISNTFKCSSTSMKVTATANVVNQNGQGSIVNNLYPNHKYQIRIQKVNWLGGVTEISNTTFRATGSQYSAKFNGLNKNDTYQLQIVTSGLPAGTEVVGSGSLTNYVII